MDPERWRQVEQLYHAALEKKPDERAAFLNQACAGRLRLRAGSGISAGRSPPTPIAYLQAAVEEVASQASGVSATMLR